jgi:hypothetical protein
MHDTNGCTYSWERSMALRGAGHWFSSFLDVLAERVHVQRLGCCWGSGPHFFKFSDGRLWWDTPSLDFQLYPFRNLTEAFPRFASLSNMSQDLSVVVTDAYSGSWVPLCSEMLLDEANGRFPSSYFPLAVAGIFTNVPVMPQLTQHHLVQSLRAFPRVPETVELGGVGHCFAWQEYSSI